MNEWILFHEYGSPCQCVYMFACISGSTFFVYAVSSEWDNWIPGSSLDAYNSVLTRLAWNFMNLLSTVHHTLNLDIHTLQSHFVCYFRAYMRRCVHLCIVNFVHTEYFYMLSPNLFHRKKIPGKFSYCVHLCVTAAKLHLPLRCAFFLCHVIVNRPRLNNWICSKPIWKWVKKFKH